MGSAIFSNILGDSPGLQSRQNQSSIHVYSNKYCQLQLSLVSAWKEKKKRKKEPPKKRSSFIGFLMLEIAHFQLRIQIPSLWSTAPPLARAQSGTFQGTPSRSTATETSYRPTPVHTLPNKQRHPHPGSMRVWGVNTYRPVIPHSQLSPAYSPPRCFQQVVPGIRS